MLVVCRTDLLSVEQFTKLFSCNRTSTFALKQQYRPDSYFVVEKRFGTLTVSFLTYVIRQCVF